jgi:hypothetical protein
VNILAQWMAHAPKRPPRVLKVSSFLNLNHNFNPTIATMKIDTSKAPKEKPLSTPLVADESNTIHFKSPTPSRQYGIYQPAKDLLDREERAVAALLTRFKSLVSLAAMPAIEGDGAVKEVAASHAFQMEVESNALVRYADFYTRKPS